MSERREPTPVALYVRVSSDRQDVDLSVAAQLRALKAHADKKGYLVVRAARLRNPCGCTRAPSATTRRPTRASSTRRPVPDRPGGTYGISYTFARSPGTARRP